MARDASAPAAVAPHRAITMEKVTHRHRKAKGGPGDRSCSSRYQVTRCVEIFGVSTEPFFLKSSYSLRNPARKTASPSKATITTGRVPGDAGVV